MAISGRKVSYTSVRNNEPTKWDTCEKHPVQVMWSILKYELGYGGKVMGVSPTKLQVFTQVLSARDLVTVTGDYKDMDVVIKAVAYHLQSQPTVSETYDTLTKTIGPVAGTALYVTACARILTGGAFGGGSRLRAIAIAAVGVEDIKIALLLMRLSGPIYREDDDDFLAALELIYDGVAASEVGALV